MGITGSHLPCLVPKIAAQWQKKRGIGKKLFLAVRTVMLQEQVEMDAGDFNGSAWRRQSGSDPRPISIIEEAFVNTNLPVPPGPRLVGCVRGL